MEKVKVGMLGYGTIGRGVFEIMKMNRAYITANSGKVIEISRVLVRDVEKNQEPLLSDPTFTTSIDDIINDGSIQIVVELMGGEEPATEYMLRALRAGKHVVTANKLAVAVGGDKLIGAAREMDRHFFYEASVGGGIPIIRQINESLNANRIESIAGIINGTSNYILTKMSKQGKSFEEALALAQQKGYAEADPTSDVGGFDAVYKLAIMTSLSFFTTVDYRDIYREGIEKVTAEDIEYAKRFGYVIKLLAIAKLHGKQLELRVHPAMVRSDHPMANINNSYNAIYIVGNAVDDIMISGKGAGAMPTGSAVVSDIISIVKGEPIVEGVGVPKRELGVMDIGETYMQYYIRLTVRDAAGVLAEISSVFARHQVSICTLVQEKMEGDLAQLIFTTHFTKEGSLRQAVEAIEKLDVVEQVSSLIRIEELAKE